METGIEIAVIPAAGLGTRMHPLSKAVPKEMLPVGRWPMFQYAVMEAIEAGVKELVMVLPPGRKRSLVAYLEEMQLPEVDRPLRSVCEIHRVYQSEPRGLADAVCLAEPKVAGRPFFVLLPDNVFFGAVSPARQLTAAYAEFRSDTLGLVEVNETNAHRYGSSGLVDLQPAGSGYFRITRLHDKRPGSLESKGGERVFRNCGRYVLTPDFFEFTHRWRGWSKGELDDIPVLQELVAQKLVIGVPLAGELFDTGHWDGYFAANAYWLKEHGVWN